MVRASRIFYLMLANYFASTSDLPEVISFFENYQAAQSDVLLKPGELLNERSAKSLKEARSQGCYLVALCRYSLNLGFEGALLRALEEALNNADSDNSSPLLIDSHYREAVRRIKDWEERKNTDHFYISLESKLAGLYPDWTINDLLDGLQQFDSQAFSVLRFAFMK